MKYRNCIQIIWHSVWLGILINAFLTQNEVCRLVPQEINRCLTYGGRYIFMTHILQLASKLCYAGFILSRFNIIKYESVSAFWSRLVLPLTSTVCLMYYILYTINPDLVRNPQAVQVKYHKIRFKKKYNDKFIVYSCKTGIYSASSNFTCSSSRIDRW